MGSDDVEAVWRLWAEYISQGFARSLSVRGHRRHGLSLDRWGPGIPVPFDDTDDGAEPSAEPSVAIRDYLNELPASPEAGAAVAEIGQENLVGFTTYSLRRHPVLRGVVGHIDDIYAQRNRSESVVLMALIEKATASLSERGVRKVEYLLPRARQSRLLRRKLLGTGWESSGEWVSYWQ
jgi:hypothetical protein